MRTRRAVYDPPAGEVLSTPRYFFIYPADCFPHYQHSSVDNSMLVGSLQHPDHLDSRVNVVDHENEVWYFPLLLRCSVTLMLQDFFKSRHFVLSNGAPRRSQRNQENRPLEVGIKRLTPSPNGTSGLTPVLVGSASVTQAAPPRLAQTSKDAF